MSDEVLCTHDLLLFGSDEDLVAASRSFVTDGIAAGDLVMVHGPGRGAEVLREAFDDDPRIRFFGGTSVYTSMAVALAEYQRLCERENRAGRRVRSIAPVPFDDDPAMRAEWMRYEALVGRALAPYRFSGLCTYDTRTTPEWLRDLALDTHANVVTAEGSRANPRVRQGADVLRAIDQDDSIDPLATTTTPVLTNLNCTAAAPVRHGLQRALRAAELPDDRAERFVAGVNEIVTNALQHGRPPVQVRLYAEGNRWLCTVTDHGPGIDDHYLGIDSPLPGTNPTPAGMGIWTARQLCDRLVVTNSPAGGATIALHLTGGQVSGRG
jgi:anti-sigma regulatory factor (Ser/Thr protein kinase)